MISLCRVFSEILVDSGMVGGAMSREGLGMEDWMEIKVILLFSAS